MKNFEEIIEVIKNIISPEVKGKVYDKHVAGVLNMTTGNLATAKKRNNIPYDEVLDFCAIRKISANYMLYGQSPESLVEATNKAFMARHITVNNSEKKSA